MTPTDSTFVRCTPDKSPASLALNGLGRAEIADLPDVGPDCELWRVVAMAVRVCVKCWGFGCDYCDHVGIEP